VCVSYRRCRVAMAYSRETSPVGDGRRASPATPPTAPIFVATVAPRHPSAAETLSDQLVAMGVPPHVSMAAMQSEAASQAILPSAA